MKILLCVDDIFFLSKIRAAAKVVGAECRSALSIIQVQEVLRVFTPERIIIDLNSKKFIAVDLIQALKSDPVSRSLPIVGYLSHIQTELLQQAKDAGCDHVWPRSKFTSDLEVILSGAL